VIPGSLEGTAESKGTGLGLGANLGATWEFLESQRIALTVRTPMNVDYSGTFTIDNVPLPAYGLGVMRSTSFESGIRFPTIVSVGYGIQVSDKVRLETDFEWLQFSRFKSLNVDFANDNILFPSRENRMDWKNSFTVGLGMDWKFAPNWVFRGGYQYYMTPIPDYTYTPAIPDANEHVLTVGLGYHYKKSSFELAYGLPFFLDRNINNNQNPAYLGTYQETVQFISFQYQLSF
jgi:long-chain fatty acid transport protein